MLLSRRDVSGTYKHCYVVIVREDCVAEGRS
jgi:hypothetical protein